MNSEPSGHQDGASDDYARQRVPDGATIHGFGIAVVVAGIGATLPLFAVGSQISIGLGLGAASRAFFVGCALVGILSAATSVVGSRARLSTYMILSFPFGPRGAQAVNVLLALLLIGFFSTTSELLGSAIHDALVSLYAIEVPTRIFTAAALCAMTTTAIFGFKLMERFSLVTVPLLLALMAYVVYLSLARRGLTGALARSGDHSVSPADALSSVIGVGILTAVLAPDLTRFTRNDRHALLTVLGLVIGFPIALLVAAVPAAALDKPDLMGVMIFLGIPGVAVCVLIMSTWTSNTSNLYCSTLTLATLFRRTSVKKIGLCAAGVALAAALIGLARYLVPLMVDLGVLAAPLGGVYIADFFVVRRQRYHVEALASMPPFRVTAFIAWLAGSTVGWIAATGGALQLTHVPALDSIIVASVLYVLLNAVLNRRVRSCGSSRSYTEES